MDEGSTIVELLGEDKHHAIAHVVMSKRVHNSENRNN